MATISPPKPPPSAEAVSRNRRQQGLFFGGVAFVVFSTLVTRRSLARRYRPVPSPLSGTPISKGPIKSGQAAGYNPASAAPKPAGSGGAAAETAQTSETMSAAEELHNSGPMVALEALSLATLNVFSWAIMATGGALWAFDISSMDDLRKKVRTGMGIGDRTEQDAEEEMEEWLATVLARKEEKEKRGLQSDGTKEGKKGK